MATQPQRYRVKVYLPDRIDRKLDVRYTGWTFMEAHTRTLLRTTQQRGDRHPALDNFHYAGRYTDGSAWLFSQIDAFVSLSDVTFEGDFVRFERAVSGPLRRSDETDELDD